MKNFIKLCKTLLSKYTVYLPSLQWYVSNSFFLENSSAKRGDQVENGWPPKGYYITYNMSKVGLSALSRLQQKDFDRDSREDIILNHVHPGYVNTQMSEYKGVLTTERGKPLVGF